MRPILYKYLPSKRISYFEDELLRFTQAKDLNDSFELAKIKNPKIEVFKSTIEISDLEREFLISNFFKNKTNEIESFGILSLSMRSDSTLMWSHYAESHSGFAIGFNLNHPFFDSERFLVEAVKYSNERVEFDKKKDFNSDIYFTKSFEWSYEQEFRIIAPLEDYYRFIEFEPYNIYLFIVPFDAIEEIIVGSKISLEKLRKIKKFTDDKNIKLYRSLQSNKTFTLEKQLII